MTRQRVWFVNRFYAPCYSATSKVLTELAEGLAADGFDVGVIASRMRYDAPEVVLPRSEIINGVRVRRAATTRFGRKRLIGRAVDYMSFYLSSFWSTVKLVRCGDIVVAKTDPPLLGVSIALAAKIRRAKLVQWLQDLFPEVASALGMRITQGRFGALIKWLRNRSFLSAHRCIAIGERMRVLVQSRVPQRPGLVQTIPNWTDVERLTPVNSEDNILRADWALGQGLVLGYSGNLGRAHESDTFLAADALLRERGIQCTWLFIGGGAGYEALKEQVQAAGLTNWCFKPYQPAEQLRYSLSVPDVHLVCLRPELEGLIVPSKIYGVAAVGRPVLFIGDPEGEVGQLLREGEFGYSVRSGDERVLAERIELLAPDAELRSFLGTNARRMAEREFGLPRALTAWRECLWGIAQG